MVDVGKIYSVLKFETEKKKLIYVLIFPLMFAFFLLFSPSIGVAEEYPSSGTLTSSNLLTTNSDISAFSADVSSLPSGTSLEIQFSTDQSTWYDSSGTTGEWDTLSAGSQTLDLSGLNLSTSTFYYRMELTSNSDNTETPVVDSVSLHYSMDTVDFLTNPHPPDGAVRLPATTTALSAYVSSADGSDLNLEFYLDQNLQCSKSGVTSGSRASSPSLAKVSPRSA